MFTVKFLGYRVIFWNFCDSYIFVFPNSLQPLKMIWLFDWICPLPPFRGIPTRFGHPAPLFGVPPFLRVSPLNLRHPLIQNLFLLKTTQLLLKAVNTTPHRPNHTNRPHTPHNHIRPNLLRNRRMHSQSNLNFLPADYSSRFFTIPRIQYISLERHSMTILRISPVFCMHCLVH